MQRISLAVVLAIVAGGALAQSPYASRSDGTIWMNGFGQCWRTGNWTPAQAVEPCDGAPRAAAPAAAQPVAQAVELAPAPTPAPVVAEAPRAAPEKLTLSADVLFDFNSAQLKEEGKRKLDELAQRVRAAEQITVIGHTDRLGSERYNQKLSEARAMAVKEYLQPGTAGESVRIVGKGKSETLVGDACKGRVDRKLIDCLQPDRRVEIELSGPRAMAGEPGMMRTGGSSTGGSSAPIKRLKSR